MSDLNPNEKVEITVSVTKDGQTAKLVLDYDQVRDLENLHNQNAIEMSIEILRQEIERGI